MKKVPIVTLLFIVICSSLALGQGKLVKEYAYTSLTQWGEPMPMTVYYIIDSANTILHHQKTYYRLTIATDTSGYTGYIALNLKKRKIEFISKYYNDKNYDSLTHRMKVGIPIFQFKTAHTPKIYYAGFLGDLIKVHSKEMLDEHGSKCYKMELDQFGPIPSENIVVGSLIFCDLSVYPEYINFIDPFAGSVKCMAK
ncbi:hypothetical protein [Chitinophaga sancti]|uniref:Uncharacterized protein n=1 Tax=Chitinophaga sancti TaxID=1004 RepID=A0A1K1SCF6_9BACT|nr:hypothetical protein [Chitinophaga sancti]WQD63611.1 hypothetical protein U0033_04330 [Chitinophaga sancti]WQG90764.1 hypothetical protein SR876_04590 [Chitinophaga sancti]SFW82043.1 hypothetical protein SAMN05661012_05186 [Chitinophaga sancti]